MQKKYIKKNAVKVSILTLLSRFFGIIREFLIVKYLGAGAISDAFLTAYKIPNSLRKIFAEGALSASLVPTFVSLVRKKDSSSINKLVLFSILFFEGIVFLLCALIMFNTEKVLTLVAGGFSAEQISYAVPCLQIVMPFIFFISTSALFASVLQSVGHFFIPAFGPVLLNIVFISSLLICMYKNLPIEYLCFFILFGGLVQLITHIIVYFKLGFSFEWFDKKTLHSFKAVIKKFIPCFICMSVVEIGLFIDTSFGSYLPHGSVSLIYYAFRFMHVPLGVFATSLSTILLPYFSKISLYAPKRLSFYLLESIKLVFWAMIPVMILMTFVSQDIFTTIYLSKKFTFLQCSEAGKILLAYLAGLVFFSLNKILLNMFYALNNTVIPMVITIVITGVNFLMNLLLMPHFQATGIALATTISAFIQTLLFLSCLLYFFNFKIYLKRLCIFAYSCFLQYLFIFIPMYGVYRLCLKGISLFPPNVSYFLLESLGFWLWIGPLSLTILLLIYVTRRKFSLSIYFLD